MSVFVPTTHAHAFAVAALGVVVLSPDALMIKALSIDVWSLVFYRNAFLLTFLLAVVFARRTDGAVDVAHRLGGAGVLAGVLYGLSALCFILSMRQTTAANAVVILGAMPMAAAVMRRVFLKKATPMRTWIAAAAVLAALAYLSTSEMGQADLWGMLAAVGAMVFYSGHVTVLSAHPHMDRVAVLAVGAGGAAIAGLALAANLTVTATELGLLAVLGIVVVGGAHMAFGLATRILSGPEVSLIVLLEMILGPLWVWLVLAEVPAQATVSAGGVIAVSVAIHSVLALRTRR